MKTNKETHNKKENAQQNGLKQELRVFCFKDVLKSLKELGTLELYTLENYILKEFKKRGFK